jgi:hypothetical protein
MCGPGTWPARPAEGGRGCRRSGPSHDRARERHSQLQDPLIENAGLSVQCDDFAGDLRASPMPQVRQALEMFDEYYLDPWDPGSPGSSPLLVDRPRHRAGPISGRW